MKINWKLRFKNKVTLISIITAMVALVYQTLGIFHVAVPISQDIVIQWVGEVINLLVLLGIVVDSTTKGISDSEQALSYDQPAEPTRIYK